MDHHNEDDAPPPYSEIDPLILQQSQPVANSGSNENEIPTDTQHPQLQLPLRLRGGDAPLPTPTPTTATPAATATATASTSTDNPQTETLPPEPVPFASAAAYFAERPPPPVSPLERDTLVHHMTIYARSQGKDFPRRPRCWNSRADEITQHDWDTFLNFLFPPHLAPAASSNRLPHRLRAEIERDRKDRPQETDEEREVRIAAVLTEWNEGFFGPRATWVSWVYVADLETGPPSPLCPECYPVATQASQNRNRQHTRSRSVEAPMPVQTEQSSSSATPPRQPVAPQADDGLIPVESEAPPRPFRPFAPWDLYSNEPVPPSPVEDPHIHRHSTSSSWESGPIGWAAQFSARAQKYAEKYAERLTGQALLYGKWVEQTALMRSRQIEEAALMRGRQIEEAALMRGRQIEEVGDRISNWASGLGRRGRPGRPPAQNPASNASHVAAEQRPRRASISSSSSDESLSSINSLSSVSDLDPADLATVRAQLLSLDTYHGRELHAAAVGLRSHLRVLQQSRRDARLRAHCGGSSAKRGNWGRWESPEEGRQREQQRRAMKEETKALKETFKKVERRAREEHREQCRERRDRRRCGRGHGREEGQVRQEQQVRAQRTDSVDADKEVYVVPDSHTESPGLTRSATTTPSSSSAPSLNPRDAAKAWADAQRAKAKAIQKLAKEQRKAVEKSHKEMEKELRKAAKNCSKQLRLGNARESSLSISDAGQEKGIITRGAEPEPERRSEG